MKQTLLTAIGVMALSLSAQAGIIIQFDSPAQQGVGGDVLTFTGSITNDGEDTVYLNFDSVNLGLAPESYTPNDSFFTNVPVSLAGGATTGSISLFDITLATPVADVPGIYSGTYAILGGLDGESQDFLAQAEYSVTVAPEPATFALLPLGAAALYLLRRRQSCGL